MYDNDDLEMMTKARQTLRTGIVALDRQSRQEQWTRKTTEVDAIDRARIDSGRGRQTFGKVYTYIISHTHGTEGKRRTDKKQADNRRVSKVKVNRAWERT